MDQDSVKDFPAEFQHCHGNVDNVRASFWYFPDLSVLAGYIELVLLFAGFKIMLNRWQVSVPRNPGCDASSDANLHHYMKQLLFSSFPLRSASAVFQEDRVFLSHQADFPAVVP